MPQYTTFWLALTDATPINSCISVLPAPFDDEYHDTEAADGEAAVVSVEQMQDARGLAAKQGELLCWGGRTLHWGGRASARSETPRISIAIAASDPEFEDPMLRASDLIVEGSR